uniref:MFS domain-containing protein n=1 Tax=Rhabditophanes sp. KR3021 TaxID=114890 RepID=A0AC35TKG2_9BILA
MPTDHDKCNSRYNGSLLIIMTVICLYASTTSLFFPITKSLIFKKVCLQKGFTNCSIDNKEMGKNIEIQTETNIIFMYAGVIFSGLAIFSSIGIGKLSDDFSRKYALIVPFVGLIFSDLFLIKLSGDMNAHNQSLFIVSEIVFGIFGGYMSIFACAFSYVSQATEFDLNKRSKYISYLEGSIGLGSALGFLAGTYFDKIDYNYMHVYMIILGMHFIGMFLLTFVKDMVPEEDRFNTTSILNETFVERIHERFTGWKSTFWDEDNKFNKTLLYLSIAFGLSFLALMGSSRIMFFYFKHKFEWDTIEYSRFKFPMQIVATFFALCVYPVLKNTDIKDSTLALVGLVARAFGRILLAIAWDDKVIYALIVMEAFNKFAPSGMRAMMAQTVYTTELGRLFSLISVVEAIGNLLSSFIFHTIFPYTLTFMPELSFLIMATLCIPAVILVVLADEGIQVLSMKRQSRSHKMFPQLLVKVDSNKQTGDEDSI